MIQERTENFLAHHGILGMKWGVRRFQDKSGKRTAAGKKRDSQISKRVKAVGTRLKETGKMMKNQVVDPGSYAKATREMYKKDGTKKALRRTFAYQKTSEIKDFNKSVAEIRSNKYKKDKKDFDNLKKGMRDKKANKADKKKAAEQSKVNQKKLTEKNTKHMEKFNEEQAKTYANAQEKLGNFALRNYRAKLATELTKLNSKWVKQSGTKRLVDIPNYPEYLKEVSDLQEKTLKEAVAKQNQK